MAKVIRAGKKHKAQIEGKKVKVKTKKVRGVNGMLEAVAGKKVTLMVTPQPVKSAQHADLKRMMDDLAKIKGMAGPLMEAMEKLNIGPAAAIQHLIYGHAISALLERASDLGKLTVPQQAETFTGLTEMSSTFDTALKAFKEVVKAKIVAEGEPFGEHGTGKALHVDGWTWPVTPHTPAGTLDDKKVEAMLRAKGLSPEIFMDKEPVTYKANKEKLLAEKAIAPEDITNCEKKPVWSLQAPRKAADKGQAERVSTLGVDNYEGEEG